VIIALIASLFLVAGCGDDGPTTPGGGSNTQTVTGATVSTKAIDYGVVCFGSDKTLSFKVKANDNNTTDATGTVELGENGDGSYTIESGGGEFTLGPGEEKTVKVRYNPQDRYQTHAGDVQVLLDGGDDLDVALTGYGSERPYLEFAPGGSITPIYDTNYGPWVTTPVTVLMDSNVDYEDPSWLECNGPAWSFNGNSITESRVGVELTVPSGTSKMTVTMLVEVEGDCTQLLIEVDGTEHRWEDLAGRCQERRFTVGVSPGKQRIYVGTDQSSFCSDDLVIWWVKLEFNRACLSPDE
jgi:hypothetical protein